MRSLKRIGTLFYKESLQIVRDPSMMLIAFVFPVIMLFLFASAVSLDIKELRIGVLMESNSASANSLVASFTHSKFFKTIILKSRKEVKEKLVEGSIRGAVIVPSDFDERLQKQDSVVQILTDGATPNTANFVSNYAQGLVSHWLSLQNSNFSPSITLQSRFWFNAELENTKALIPGAIAIIMTMIGTLLTAMVVAREWERGTMEALLSTPTRIYEMLLGKLLPYFILAMLSTLMSALLCIVALDVPMRGSFLALFTMSAAFLIPALGQGLLISALAKNQFVAAQGALLSGFLPAFLLSGYLFEISSMPNAIQIFTNIIAARHFVSSLRTLFLVGDVWEVLLPNLAMMVGIGLCFFAIALSKTKRELDK